MDFTLCRLSGALTSATVAHHSLSDSPEREPMTLMLLLNHPAVYAPAAAPSGDSETA